MNRDFLKCFKTFQQPYVACVCTVEVGCDRAILVSKGRTVFGLFNVKLFLRFVRTVKQLSKKTQVTSNT